MSAAASKFVLTASCQDLLLARDCIATLDAAGFAGQVNVRPPARADVLRGQTVQLYGGSSGEAAGRGLLFGGLFGLMASGLALSFLAPWWVLPPPLAAGLIAVATALGGLIGWVLSRSGATAAAAAGDRFEIRCEGDADQIELAREALRDSPCEHLQIRQAGPGPA